MTRWCLVRQSTNLGQDSLAQLDLLGVSTTGSNNKQHVLRDLNCLKRQLSSEKPNQSKMFQVVQNVLWGMLILRAPYINIGFKKISKTIYVPIISNVSLYVLNNPI